MGRAPCCDKANVKKGPWSPEEDEKLKDYIEKCGTGGNWIALPQKAGLKRCGKSCRLRWLNYLRPNIKHGEFTDQEDRIICSLYTNIGSRWSIIAAQLPGRTDNDIKNYWNTKLKKKLMGIIIPPQVPSSTISSTLLQSSSSSSYKHNNDTTIYNNTLPTRSFEPMSFSQTLLSSSVFQAPQERFLGSMKHNDQVKKNPIFGCTDQYSSCSSNFDGSYNNQIRHGRETEYDKCVYNGLIGENQKLLFSKSMWDESSTDYSLEEIKQLISSNTCSNNNNFLLFDENKKATEERVTYYY